jgi:hypothetical protein
LIFHNSKVHKLLSFIEHNQLNKINKAKQTFEKGIALARKQGKEKTLREIQGSFEQFKDETDD